MPSLASPLSTSVVPGRTTSGFRSLPNAYAVFSSRFIFTTLTPKEAAHGPYAHPTEGKPMHMFSLDDDMVYTAFKNDHGPLNLAYTFDACVRIYDKLNEKKNLRRAICLYSNPCPRSKSNMALISALYSLIVEHQDPWDCFQALSHFELLPFRDAGNGGNEFALTVQDVLYGVWKAGQHNLLQLSDFDVEDYRYFERVENGDLNTLGNFVAFASPMDTSWIQRRAPPEQKGAMFTSAQTKMLSSAFDKVKRKFYEENVGLVVRLNDELYDRTHFLESGIQHVDMYFDDGTNPTDDIVRDFIRLAEETIARGKKVAVHCKAGLGRTGVLIGAYLIYKYQFSASEVIGYMRLVRPGMVVGPQQRYMQLNQLKWAGWAAIDEHRRVMANTLPPSPPLESDATFGPIAHPHELGGAANGGTKAGDAQGQPRKNLIRPELTPEPDVPEPTTPPRNRAVSTATPDQEGSVRGVKRGSGRSPLPQVCETPTRRVEPTPPRLIRSPSTASCSSSVSELDQRATKRRNGDPPLSKSGLSSPPPSRETTPCDDFKGVAFPIEEAEEPITPPTATLVLDTQVMTPPNETTPRSRSLLPRRPALPTFKDKELTPRAGAHPPSSSTDGSLSDSELTSSSVSSTGSMRSKHPLRRTFGATPRVWNTLSRLGGAALGHDCEYISFSNG